MHSAVKTLDAHARPGARSSAICAVPNAAGEDPGCTRHSRWRVRDSRAIRLAMPSLSIADATGPTRCWGPQVRATLAPVTGRSRGATRERWHRCQASARTTATANRSIAHSRRCCDKNVAVPWVQLTRSQLWGFLRPRRVPGSRTARATRPRTWMGMASGSGRGRGTELDRTGPDWTGPVFVMNFPLGEVNKQRVECVGMDEYASRETPRPVRIRTIRISQPVVPAAHRRSRPTPARRRGIR